MAVAGWLAKTWGEARPFVPGGRRHYLVRLVHAPWYFRQGATSSSVSECGVGIKLTFPASHLGCVTVNLNHSWAQPPKASLESVGMWPSAAPVERIPTRTGCQMYFWAGACLAWPMHIFFQSIRLISWAYAPPLSHFNPLPPPGARRTKPKKKSEARSAEVGTDGLYGFAVELVLATESVVRLLAAFCSCQTRSSHSVFQCPSMPQYLMTATTCAPSASHHLASSTQQRSFAHAWAMRAVPARGRRDRLAVAVDARGPNSGVAGQLVDSRASRTPGGWGQRSPHARRYGLLRGRSR